MEHWEESKHPRDEDGKFTSSGGTPAENKKLEQMGIKTNEDNKEFLTEEEKRLEELGIEVGSNKLSHSEQGAVLKYFSSESYKINEKLYSSVELDENDKEFIRIFDNALSKIPYVKNQTLTRDYIFNNQELKNEFIKNLSVGGIIRNSAYWSATKLTNYHDNPDVRFIIRNANRARDVESFESKGEREALYERNSQFKILSKRILTNHSNLDIIIFELGESYDR